MQLQPIDIGIIAAYLGVIMIAGFAMSKLASRNLESYFLGGHAVPWYVLGVANASGMFDITGTMWLVMTVFVYGLKGVFLPWVWPVFNQVFLMVFLAVWLRRSGVMTGAEWITTRFGDRTGAKLSHVSVVIFAVVSVIGFLAYAFRGIGKFSAIFFPWDLSWANWCPAGVLAFLGRFLPESAFTADTTYAIILMGVTSLYVIFGGMLSVTVTDVIQYLLMTVSSVFIAVIALRQTTVEQISAAVPDGWHNLLFGWRLELDWSQHIPQINEQLANDGWELFGIVFMIVLFKGILNSAAGPAPNYDMQRVLSTRSPKEAAKMSWFVSVVLFMPRYLMIVGITLLGLIVFKDVTTQMEGGFDAEKVLPSVIEHLPAGLTGLVVAGLLAAFMSTFSATINAGASYVVNDLYKKHINPNAPAKQYVYASYVCSVLVLIVGIAFGMMTKSVNTVTQWIVNGLFGGYTAANILKWYWWRFNGFGYFSGMISGVLAAIFLPLPLVLQDQNLLWNLERNIALFPIILAISLAASVIVSLCTKPDEEQVLKKFYRQVRPWGFWGPIRALVCQEDPSFRPNTAFRRDMTNVAVGIVWQLTLVLVPTYLLIRSYRNLGITVAVLLVTSIFLKINWYDKLENE